MTKKSIISILILSLLLGLILLYFFYPRRVNIEFVSVFSATRSIEYVHETIYSERETLQHVSSDSTDILYYTDVRNNLEQFDFNTYDYLFVIGKEAIEVQYSPYISYVEDMDSHYSGTPVLVIHKNSKQNKIFVYRLPKNPKYRHPCC